jgi:hypothetical protein
VSLTHRPPSPRRGRGHSLRSLRRGDGTRPREAAAIVAHAGGRPLMAMIGVILSVSSAYSVWTVTMPLRAGK